MDFLDVFAGAEVVVSGWAYHPDSQLDSLTLYVKGARVPHRHERLFRGARPDVANFFHDSADGRWGFVWIAQLEEPLRLPAVLRVEAGARRCEVPLTARHESAEKLRASIQAYSPNDRDAVLTGLLEADHPQGLRGLAAVAPSELPGFVRAHVEFATAVAQRGVFAHGWLLDPVETITAAHICAAGHSSADVLAGAGRFARPDVDVAFPEQTSGGQPSGLVFWAPMALEEAPQQVDLVLTAASGAVARISAPVTPAAIEPLERSKAILANFDPTRLPSFELLERHMGPALEALWDYSRPKAGDVQLHEFGCQPKQPHTTVVIPLYGRCDFVLYQLSHFCRDADFDATEILYVLDDPRLYDQLLGLCSEVHPVFRLPFRLVCPGKNLGYAGANNLGVSHARAPLLVLLNSDVLPRRPGWLSRLERQYTSLDAPGPIAPRLLFEDGTVQHDGITFQHHPRFPKVWLNAHPGKGLPPRMVPGDRVAAVPAVTGACLMIARDLYADLGGMDEGYILGDFEDSDLCLKAAQAGHRTHVIRDVELFHLERLSQSMFQDTAWKMKLTLYNAWRFTRRWREEIESLAEAAEEGASR